MRADFGNIFTFSTMAYLAKHQLTETRATLLLIDPGHGGCDFTNIGDDGIT
jgi:N-acetylmuramoyl-L-alanine amidase